MAPPCYKRGKTVALAGLELSSFKFSIAGLPGLDPPLLSSLRLLDSFPTPKEFTHDQKCVLGYTQKYLPFFWLKKTKAHIKGELFIQWELLFSSNQTKECFGKCQKGK